jgi:hypothetical protein
MARYTSKSKRVFVMDFTPNDTASPPVILSRRDRTKGHMVPIYAILSFYGRDKHEVLDTKRLVYSFPAIPAK